MTDEQKLKVEALAKKLLKTIGKEQAIVSMNALYMAMQAVDIMVHGVREKKGGA